MDGGKNAGVALDQWVPFDQRTTIWYSSVNPSIQLIKKQLNVPGKSVLFVIGIYSFHYNLLPLFFAKTDVKLVSVRGMLHPGALAQKWLKKKFYLALWKTIGIHLRVSFHATDKQEHEFISKVFGIAVNTFIAGNFPRAFKLQENGKKQTGVLRLITVALISPMKNILLVLNALMESAGNIHYEIYGPIKDSKYWQECLKLIARLPPNIEVQYHGDIKPWEVENILTGAEVFIMPSESENFGHAIYEALSAGKPVITSRNTPWQDLEKTHAGQNVNTEVKSVASAIRAFVLFDEETYRHWSACANRYATRKIDLELTQKQYVQMFQLQDDD